MLRYPRFYVPCKFCKATWVSNFKRNYIPYFWGWQNIQINGQYTNSSDSIKAFINVLLCSKLKHGKLLLMHCFFPAFLHCVRMHLLNLKFQSVIIPKSFCAWLPQIFKCPTFTNITCDQITKSDICLDSILCNCFQTIL